MNITPNKQNKLFRPDSVYTLSAEEINQIVAELMSVINWGGLTPSSDPNAPQIVEALTAMLYTRDEAELTSINGITIMGHNNQLQTLGIQPILTEGGGISISNVSKSNASVLLTFDNSVEDISANPLTYTQPAQAEYGESLHANSPTKKSIKTKNYTEYGGYGPYAQAAKSSLNFDNHDWEAEFNRKATTPFADINCRVYGSRQDYNNFCSFTYDGRLSILRGGVPTTFPSNPIPQTAGEIETIKFQFEAAKPENDNIARLTVYKLIGTGPSAQIAYQESTTTAGTIYNFGYPNSQYCPIAYTPDQGGSINNALFSGFVLRNQLTPTVAGVRTTYPTVIITTQNVISTNQTAANTPYNPAESGSVNTTVQGVIDETYAEVKNNKASIKALSGVGGYLNTYDFGTASPTQENLTAYAVSQIWPEATGFSWNASQPYNSSFLLGGVIHTVQEIFNSTRVKNANNKHVWVIANTPTTTPIVFSWSDNGIEGVDIASDSTAGLIKTGTANGDVNAGANGKATVVGFDTKYDKAGGVVTGDIIISRPTGTSAVIQCNSGVAETRLTGNSSGIFLYRGYVNRLTYDAAANKWYVYKSGIAKELGLTAASELSYDNSQSGLPATIQGAIDALASGDVTPHGVWESPLYSVAANSAIVCDTFPQVILDALNNNFKSVKVEPIILANVDIAGYSSGEEVLNAELIAFKNNQDTQYIAPRAMATKSVNGTVYANYILVALLASSVDGGFYAQKKESGYTRFGLSFVNSRLKFRVNY